MDDIREEEKEINEIIQHDIFEKFYTKFVNQDNFELLYHDF